ncbi:asp-trnaasn glu-trnagln amidotransferase subunit a-like protein [Plasmopara halstedii]|uniref:Asp-trnaasn glu-trnagln amidotransferase subunit a-like protein n=1 Tax=Plasmopara halstedii TaxID=4781 RepID=A0A0P1A6S6_PLAHL|nr:asp-trnaasn glu-trnagln amidotransferase subunit a-like protein [Plasmopara halstedii]CEG35778.1 asp-trnaasn glu-trnagln amidotransferase subunit a-like protein [Plasmopara halstedii]|eukprot:XP_024572147.1 asp-trnaasn glu-trnagln amidotransferase subunit a-like protein [Plasmopara halstedii]
MVSISLMVAAMVLVVSALLMLGDREDLPSYVTLKQQWETSSGYDLGDLSSPILYGQPLIILAYLARLPVLSRILCNQLAKENKIIEARKLAASIADLPLYYPYVEPTQSDAEQGEESLSLLEFSKKGVKKEKATTAFKHWSISDYTVRYTSGEVTPVQVAKALLAAAEKNQQSEYPLNVFVEKHDDWIMAQAQASAERYARGEPLGVLDGVPVAIKDEARIKDHRMFIGTSFLGYEEEPATKDDTPVARLRAAGAIILGTTNMHEVGSGVTGYNKHYGTVRNPYNPKCYSGGSSSGSAAAVASGLVPLALGLDGGGSIRIPSSLCGVVGMKPTFQRIPFAAADCPSVAHVGPIAGSVRDAAIGYAIMSGSDKSFPLGMTQPSVDLHSFEDTSSLKGIRIGYFPEYSNHSSLEIAEAVTKTLQALKSRGAELIETPLDHLSAIHVAHAITITSEFAQNLDKYYERFGEMSPETQIILAFGRSFTAMDFLAAQRIRAFALRQFQEKVLSKVHAFVTPSTGITAPEIPLEAFKAGELNAAQIGNILRFSVYGNLIGVPSIAVPIGYDSRGLPMSIQFQTAHWQEDLMLRLAHVTEKLYAEIQKRPQIYFSTLDDAANYASN